MHLQPPLTLLINVQASQACPRPSDQFYLWNRTLRLYHRTAWVEKDLKDHLVSTPLLCAGSPTTRPGCPEPHPALQPSEKPEGSHRHLPYKFRKRVCCAKDISSHWLCLRAPACPPRGRSLPWSLPHLASPAGSWDSAACLSWRQIPMFRQIH